MFLRKLCYWSWTFYKYWNLYVWYNYVSSYFWSNTKFVQYYCFSVEELTDSYYIFYEFIDVRRFFVYYLRITRIVVDSSTWEMWAIWSSLSDSNYFERNVEIMNFSSLKFWLQMHVTHCQSCILTTTFISWFRGKK